MDSITVEINVTIIKEGDYFVFHCEALGLSSYGTSKEKARSRFEEELMIFFEETAKKGTLEKYLLQKGWTLTQKPVPSYRPPEYTDAFPNFMMKQSNSFTERIAIPI